MAEFRLAIQMIAAELGDELAARLEYHFAGTRIYIPVEPGENHILTRMLGRDAARTLGAKFGGDVIDIPMGKHRGRKRREMIARLHAQGMINSAIAREVGVTERYVYDVLAAADGRGEPQRGLFPK